MDHVNNDKGHEVQVTLLFFAKSRELVEQKTAEIRLPKRVSRGDLIEAIVSLFPSIAQIQNNIILAVNQQYVEAGRLAELHQGDEIAVIPPISGG